MPFYGPLHANAAFKDTILNHTYLRLVQRLLILRPEMATTVADQPPICILNAFQVDLVSCCAKALPL